MSASSSDNRGGRSGDQTLTVEVGLPANTNIELPPNTKIIYPHPTQLEITPPKGSSITLGWVSMGNRITLTSIRPGTFDDDGLVGFPAGTNVVLSNASELLPGSGDLITVPAGVDPRGSDSKISLPAGTAVSFNAQLLRRDSTLPSVTTDSITCATTLSSNVTLPSDVAMVVGGDTVFPAA
ncbi:hypothetical protein F5Y13DRAFT_159166 [Hypoxylon sp. FL1857]|nr:hypothetical protein F5Y13DRAFT_159166 [Hypoxylon sp. FL1857]